MLLILKLLIIVFLIYAVSCLLITLIKRVINIEVETSLKGEKYSDPSYRSDQLKHNLKKITEHRINKQLSHQYSPHVGVSEEITFVSVIQAAAHNSRSRLYDSRLNTTFDYTTEIDQAKNTYIDLDESLLEEEIEKVKEEIHASQKTISHDSPMIPLSVPYEERQLVKSLGASWCHNTRTWFWPFTKKREAVDKWLPRIYKLSQVSPYILPQLVPEPLWYINLRSLLTPEQWKSLRTKIYKQAGYRCSRCGCRGTKWPVECNEIWGYEIKGLGKAQGIVHFQGLEALCPSCHQIIHLGKAQVDGFEHKAIARLMYLNEWKLEEAERTITKTFQDWEKRSAIKDWFFNLEVLENSYALKIPSFEYLKGIVNKKTELDNFPHKIVS